MAIPLRRKQVLSLRPSVESIEIWLSEIKAKPKLGELVI